MWDETIAMSRRLLDSYEDDEDEDGEVSWSDFPVEHWERRRTRLDRAKAANLDSAAVDGVDPARDAIKIEPLIEL